MEDVIFCKEGIIASLEYNIFNNAQQQIILEDTPPEQSQLYIEDYQSNGPHAGSHFIGNINHKAETMGGDYNVRFLQPSKRFDSYFDYEMKEKNDIKEAMMSAFDKNGNGED